ncbi:hypothetical protein BSKO_00495 [Bryopsis sp. KO-2023]|nr:hypothetical protein BSKO_00495 [Bryopsis sp. KO-2023]
MDSTSRLENSGASCCSDTCNGRRKKRRTVERCGGGGRWQDDIPEHLLLLIFETMQLREDGVELLKAAKRVCRRWRRAAQGTLLLDTAATRMPRKPVTVVVGDGEGEDSSNGGTCRGLRDRDDGEREIQSRAKTDESKDEKPRCWGDCDLERRAGMWEIVQLGP